MKEQIRLYLKSGVKLIAVDTIETSRVCDYIESVVKEMNAGLSETTAPDYLKSKGYQFGVWNVSTGWEQMSDSKIVQSGTPDLIKALDAVLKDFPPGVFIITNAHMLWDNPLLKPRVVQTLINLSKTLPPHKHLMFVGGLSGLPEEASTLFSIAEFALPSRDDLVEIIAPLEDMISGEMDDRKRKEIANAMSGMTLYEARMALNASVVMERGKEVNITHLQREKSKAVKRSGLLEYEEVEEDISQVGGLKNFKEWLDGIESVFRNPDKALSFGLPVPKGCLVAGVAGTGKSLLSRVIAKKFGAPLFLCDVGRVFGSLVGETERNARALFKLIDAVSPCVVRFEEIEKSMSGVASSAYSDAGVTDRFFSSLLTYMQEKKSMSFFVATANEVEKLPSPFLRRGRFDAIWFVDLPGNQEREEILQIHLAKVGRDPKKFDIKKLAKLTENYTGSEIEGLVVDALYKAFKLDREINTKDFIEIIKTTPLLVKTKEEEIRNLRSWARGRARIANVETDADRPAWWAASNNGEEEEKSAQKKADIIM